MTNPTGSEVCPECGGAQTPRLVDQGPGPDGMGRLPARLCRNPWHTERLRAYVESGEFQGDYEEAQRLINEGDTVGIAAFLSRNVVARAEEAAQRARETVEPAPPDPPSDAERCRRCGRANPSWSAASPLWNAVMRGGSIDGEPEFDDLVCATCFMELAVEKGIASLFRVTAEIVNVELETVTPSGRVWNPDRFLWSDPPSSTDQDERVTQLERAGEALAVAVRIALSNMTDDDPDHPAWSSDLAAGLSTWNEARNAGYPNYEAGDAP